MDTYEKKYKEIVGLIKKAYLYAQTDSTKAVLEEIFPELKESEDEKVRKALAEMVHDTTGDELLVDYNVHKEEALAWLEKQGEHKPTIEMKTPEESLGINSEIYNKIIDECIYGENKPDDNVEPKFKAGDWVVISTSDGEKVVQIDSIEYFKSGEPRYITSEGRWFGNGTKAHLWTIHDAKPGNVLFIKPTENLGEQLIIFGGIDSDSRIKYYCRFLNNKFFINDGLTGYDHKYFLPATEEQRETIFAKMHEAGYMWDSESKQLLSLKAEPSGEQKPAWSEEDKNHIANILNILLKEYRNAKVEQYRSSVESDIDWLKSLKQRIGG